MNPQEIREALKKPFKDSEIEWRVQSCWKGADGIVARVLAYVQARAIQDRLDEVLGIENWNVHYRLEDVTGFICILSLKINNEYVVREDGAEATHIEAFKGGISSAFKRAASTFGVGRYLYSLDAGFAKIVEKNTKGAYYTNDKQIGVFYWLPPELPQWALPQKSNMETILENAKTILKDEMEKAQRHEAIKPIEKKSGSVPNADSSSVIAQQKPHCEGCGAELGLGKHGYYCPNYKDKTKLHTSFKEERLAEYMRSLVMRDPGNDDVP